MVSQEFAADSKSAAGAASNMSNVDIVEGAEVAATAGKASTLSTIVNIICTTVGVGMVGLPIAFAQAGWLFSIVGMTLGYIISVYCGIILWRCLNCHERPIPTFMDLGYEVAGMWGKVVTGFSVYGTCLGASILFIILAADQFQIIFGDNIMDTKLWALVFIGITLPFAFIKTLAHVAIIAVFGALASAIVFVTVVIQDIIIAAQGTQLTNLDTSTEVINTDDPLNIITAINTFIFSFGASVIFAESNVEMRNRTRFPMAVTAAYGFALVVYMIISCVSYGVYGRSLLTAPGGSIIGMLPDNWATKMMAVMFLIHLLSAFLVLLNPVFRAVETATGSDNHRLHLLFRAVQRLLIIGFCYFVAIAIPFFGQIMSLMGATTITLASFICPAWFYLAMFWRKKQTTDDTSSTGVQESSATVNTSRLSGPDLFKSDDVKKNNTETEVKLSMADDNASTVSGACKYGARVNEYTIPTWEVVALFVIIIATAILGVFGTYQSIKSIVQSASTLSFF